MKIPHVPQATPIESTSHTRWRRRLLESSIGNWLMALLFVGLPFLAANILAKFFLPDPGLRDLRNLIKVLVLVAAYWAYVRWWERRPVREFSLSCAVPELLAGLLLGGFLFSTVMALLAVFGVYSLETVGTLGGLAAVVASLLPKIAAGALLEELLFRLLALRLLERSLGTAWALAISSLLFGLAHLGNAGATPLIGIMLGIELGLLFGAAYLLTRRIWLCTALHLAWNFVQGAVFSIAVSGQTGDGWLRGSLTGPAWLTGGAFGAEASVVSFVLCLAAAGVLLALAHRNGRFFKHAMSAFSDIAARPTSLKMSLQGSADKDHNQSNSASRRGKLMDRLKTGPRLAGIEALKERIAAFDAWIADIQGDQQRTQDSNVSAESKAAALAILDGQLVRLRNGRDEAVRALAMLESNIL